MGRLNLKVVPGSSRDEIVGWLGDSLKLKVTAPPEEGRANEVVDAMNDEVIRAAFPREKPGRSGGARTRE